MDITTAAVYVAAGVALFLLIAGIASTLGTEGAPSIGNSTGTDDELDAMYAWEAGETISAKHAKALGVTRNIRDYAGHDA